MAGTGDISNNTYTSTFYGFTFQVPSKWKVLLGPSSVAAQGGCSGDQCRLLALQAPTGIGRVTIDTHALPAGTTAKDMLAKAAAKEQQMGFAPVAGATESSTGAIKVYRQDLKTDGGSAGQILETLMAAEAKGNAIMITILTDSRDTLSQLTSGLQTGDVAAKVKAPK
jgi:hypothetical protein